MEFYIKLDEIIQSHGCIMPKSRSFLFLNKKDKLVKLFEDAGFTNCQCWNTTVAYPYYEGNI